jgi:hypothetical protein
MTIGFAMTDPDRQVEALFNPIRERKSQRTGR